MMILGERKNIKIMLLAGGDLIASFGHPGVWSPEDVSCCHVSSAVSCLCLHALLVAPYCWILWMCHY